MKVDVMDQMYATRSSLTEMIVRLSPEGPAETAQHDNLVALRDRVSSAINHAIERGFQASVADVERAAADLQALNVKLDDAKGRVDALKLGLDIANKAVSILVSVIGFVA